MKVMRGLKALEDYTKDSVVTIGVFDGVHVGHAVIIKKNLILHESVLAIL